MFNYENPRGKFCISCRQDRQYVYNENSNANLPIIINSGRAFESVYGGNVLADNSTMGNEQVTGVFSSEDSITTQTFLNFSGENCKSK